jgi:hypothetical protein
LLALKIIKTVGCEIARLKHFTLIVCHITRQFFSFPKVANTWLATLVLNFVFAMHFIACFSAEVPFSFTFVDHANSFISLKVGWSD